MSDQMIVSEAELERYASPPPRYVGLEVTQRCNLQCPMCYPHGRIPHSAYRGNDIKLQVVDLLADVWPQAEQVTLTGGGEPLLLSQFPEFIDKCHAYNPNIEICFISNGVLLSEQKARMAIEKRVHKIDFSMDGTIQYGHVGGGANLDKVKDNIQRLVRLKGEYGVKEPLIGIAFVAMRDNLCELPGMVEFAAEVGARLYFQPLSPTTEEQRYQNVFRHVDYTLRVLEKCKIQAEKLGVTFDPLNMNLDLDQSTQRVCNSPREWLFVGSGGDIAPCCGGPLRAGRNIFEDGISVLQVWNGPYMKHLRWELDTKHYNEICRRCPTLWNTIENQERLIPSEAQLWKQISELHNIAEAQKQRIQYLESHLDAIRHGKVMRLMRTVNRLMGKR